MTPRWVDPNVVLAIHEQQISEHGGLLGIRDWGAIESALQRPENLLLYGSPDLFDLAAAYGFGLARNRDFTDGNKRTAYVVTRLFLILNGHDLQAPAVEKVLTYEKVDMGEMDQDTLAAWLRSHSIKLPKTSYLYIDSQPNPGIYQEKQHSAELDYGGCRRLCDKDRRICSMANPSQEAPIPG